MERVYVVFFFGVCHGVFSSEAKANEYIEVQSDGEEYEPLDWEVADWVLDEGSF